MGEKQEKLGKPKARGNGEGSIFELKGGKRKGKKNWVAQITLDNGHKKRIYCESYKEAQQSLRNALLEQEQGKLIAGKDQTVKQYLLFWFENIQRPQIRESTSINQERTLHLHILPALGHYLLRKLTTDHVQTFYTDKLKAGLSAGYIKIIHSILHKAFADALAHNKISRNIFDIVKPPRYVVPERQPLTIDQARTLQDVMKGHRFELLITLALVTGARRGEILGLCWSQVDLEARTIQIRRTISRYGSKYIETTPKTARGKRKLILPTFLIEMFRQHRAKQNEMRLKAGSEWRDQDLVFCNRTGGFFNPGDLLDEFHKILAKGQLPRLHFHDLRHSAATFLIARGVPIKVIQEILGHSHINVTLGFYGHVLPGMHEEAMNEMDRLFGK